MNYKDDHESISLRGESLTLVKQSPKDRKSLSPPSMNQTYYM